jgi:hypothetical protein
MMPNPYDSYTGRQPREGERQRPIPFTERKAWQYFAESTEHPFSAQDCPLSTWALIYRVALEAGVGWNHLKNLTGLGIDTRTHAYCYVSGQISNEISEWELRNNGTSFWQPFGMIVPTILNIIVPGTGTSYNTISKLFEGAPATWHLDNSRIDIPPEIFDEWWEKTTQGQGNIIVDDVPQMFPQDVINNLNSQEVASSKSESKSDTGFLIFALLAGVAVWIFSSK